MLTKQTAKIWKKIKRFNLKTKVPARKKIKARLAGSGKGQVGRLGRIRMMFSFRSIIIFKIMARNKTNCKKSPLRHGLILKFP